MIRNFLLAASASFGLWQAAAVLGPHDDAPSVNPEANGPLVIDEYVKVLTPGDITPDLVADGDAEARAALVGQLAIGARLVEWRMDCPLVIGSRGWSEHGELRPAANADGLLASKGASYVLRDVRAGRRRPRLVVPGPPPADLEGWPPLYVSSIEVPPNRPCVDPKTARTWSGSVAVVAAPMVPPQMLPLAPSPLSTAPQVTEP